MVKFLTNLKFGDYTFRNNPRKLFMSYTQNTSTVSCLGFGSAIQNVGSALAVVDVEGELFGQDALQQFESLRQIFAMGKSAVLAGAGIEPIMAILSTLTLLGQGGSDVISFSARFIQERIV